MPLRRIATLAGLAIGLAALILQFGLSITLRMSTGRSFLDAVVYYFTFYTILTNIMLVLIYLSDLTTARWLGWWRLASTRGMMAAVMVLVMTFYHFFLASTWNPQGWFKVADVTLHYVTPSFYVLWWIIFEPKGRLRVADLSWMLLPSVIWLIWAMIRGAFVTEYPYPILEANRLGYPTVGINILAVLAGLLVLFVIVIGIDRLVGKRA